MSMEDYLKYKKQSATADKFTLKVPYALSEFEARAIVSSIAHITGTTVLPTLPEFDKLHNDEKRRILAEAFSKGDHVYDFTRSIFKRYITNDNIYPSYPLIPYMSRIPKANQRLSTFIKARSRALMYYDMRMHPGASAQYNTTLQRDIPISYYDESTNWFKYMCLLPKTQVYFPDEAKNIKHISDGYREDLSKSFFSDNIKNKVFFFSIESVDSMGRYYPLQKQIEITHIPEHHDFAVSISVSAIPKGNHKYLHQLLRIDSGGHHTNARPIPLTAVLKDKSHIRIPTRHSTEYGKLVDKSLPLMPEHTSTLHMHLFSKESNMIYSMNPNTADAIGIGELLSLCENIDNVDISSLHPAIQNLMSDRNIADTHATLVKLQKLNDTMISGNYNTEPVEKMIESRGFSIHPTHILHYAKYLVALEMIEHMDTLIDIALNIDPVPVPIDTTSHLKPCTEIILNDSKSNRDAYFASEKQIMRNITPISNTPDAITSDTDDDIM